MKNSITLIFCFLLLMVIYARPTIAQEVVVFDILIVRYDRIYKCNCNFINAEDESQYDYVDGSIRGPTQWGNLNPEWAACKNGVEQSPIDLLYERVNIDPNLGQLQINYKPSTALLKDRGHDIMVEWTGDAGSIQINHKSYKLLQSHWHSPSEHTIDGLRFSLEQHLVHQRTDPILGNITAVIGILYNIGKPEAFLSKLEKPIKFIIDGQTVIDVGRVDPNYIKISNKDYYRYMGSLTTPPCTEGVIWTIDLRVRTISLNQLESLRAAVHDAPNARPLQPLNDRKIFIYKLKHREDYVESS
ncbi:hypothetical protein AQUCO_03000028v1 [Aquilegia coerulea]|uniref:Alpha-carbonic anhydrase domain-containing protein n=1 Tax=Aquilegia coerulea TaxID=218851 RepID=A0A2G5D0X3_AQUCA|nr:hypothetical protein AQUCO_03000028v1 [Aquilegia coerulea]